MNLLAVPLVAMEGYSSKFTIFTGAVPSTEDANMVVMFK
jgi:hypothetical protein